MTAAPVSLPSGRVRVEGNPHVLGIEKPNTPLPYDLKHALVRSACTSNHEVVGFITSRMAPYFLFNTHDEPEHNFRVDGSDVRRALELISVGNDSVIGMFHTHSDGTNYPSLTDLEGWPPAELNWRYFIVNTRGVWEYEKI